MKEKEVRVGYNVGDLVRLKDDTLLYWDTSSAKGCPEYGLVVGRTIPWDKAYNLTKTDDDSGTRYWNNVNYAPYHVMVVGEKKKLEWISPEYMELIS
tara:strand:+ start:1212 stop:1502 length:291 start_codon:yes stop_codon:yes gene_type:complete